MQSLQKVSVVVALSLALLLPFAIPYPDTRNIDMQGLLLLVSGSFACVALWRQPFHQHKRLTLLLATYVLATLLTTFVSPHLGYNVFGSPGIRLGLGAVIACVALGALVASKVHAQFDEKLYLYIGIVAVLSVIVSVIRFHSLYRFGGIFAQADIMACFLGCGLVCGSQLLLGGYHVKPLIGCQLGLTLLLLLTQTRFVIASTVVLLLVIHLRRHPSRPTVLQYIAVAACVALAIPLLGLVRLTDGTDAAQSISYRRQLQTEALTASLQKPVLGYGLGNLADALACPKLSYPALQATCNDHYFFNSSHNIFLDRILGVGIIGGSAFVALVLLTLRIGFKAQPSAAFYCFVLITAYYCTNVTSVSLELLYWILLFQVLRSAQFNRASASL